MSDQEPEATDPAPQEPEDKPRPVLGVAVAAVIVLVIALGVIVFADRGGKGGPVLGGTSVSSAPPTPRALSERSPQELATALPQQGDLPQGWTLDVTSPASLLPSAAPPQPSAFPTIERDPLASMKVDPVGCDLFTEIKNLGGVLGEVLPQGPRSAARTSPADPRVLGQARASAPRESGTRTPGDRSVRVGVTAEPAPAMGAAMDKFKAFIAKCPSAHAEKQSPDGAFSVAMDISWSQFDPPSTEGERALGLAVRITAVTAFDGLEGGGATMTARTLASWVRGVTVAVTSTSQKPDEDAALADKLYTLTVRRLHELP